MENDRNSARKPLLVVHQDEAVLKRIIELLKKDDYRVTICFKGSQGQEQMERQRFHAVLYGADVPDLRHEAFFEGVRKNPLLAHMPLLLLTADANVDMFHYELEHGADAVLPLTLEDSVLRGAIGGEIEKFVRLRLDPVTGLPSGPALVRKLEYMCDHFDKPWEFVLVKVFGVRAYSLHVGYDRGDEMLGAVARMLEDTVDELGEGVHFAGRLRGSHFCVISTAKHVEALCRKIVGKSERVFRQYYTPFEWVKGYITIEDEKHEGNYHLAEIMVSCVTVTPGWNNHYVYLFDVAEEVMRVVEKGELGHKVVNI